MDNKFDIVERKYALYVILAVKNNPGASKADVCKMTANDQRTKLMRINELIEAGLLQIKTGNQYNKMLLFLTPDGQMVADAAERLYNVLPEVDVPRKY